MLTKRQNLLETIRGGNPDRFVDQYNAILNDKVFTGMILMTPVTAQAPRIRPGDEPIVNAWGVTIAWPEGIPGQFPVHDKEHKVINDITKWRETVKMPKVDFAQSEWEPYLEGIDEIDREESFVTVGVYPGVFEQCHYLMGMDDCLLNLYEEPDEMHALIDYITEFELKYAAELIKHIKPDCIFHHDDFGSQTSSFMSPEMFEEFLVPAYQKIYGFYKENGVELIIHHSDSYGANLVPYMIDMGIDIWQGCLTTNDIPTLVKKYGGQISFMGGIDSGIVDREDWSEELVEKLVTKMVNDCGKHFYIPCITQGGPGSIYPGVYNAISEKLSKLSKKVFANEA